MKNYRLYITVIASLFVACAHVADAQEWRLVDADQIVDPTYLILTIPLDEPDAMEQVSADIAADFGVPLSAEWPLQSIVVLCLIYDASNVQDVDAMIADMEADGRIRTAQRMQTFGVSEASYADPLFPTQWSLARMNVARAHDYSTGLGVKVGVVDSAIDKSHADLAGQLVDYLDFVKVTKADTAEAHGTAVAGIIAADGTNAIGMVGVAPRASLVGLRACWQDPGQAGQCSSFSIARALNFAILNDIDVINLSLGGPQDALIEELVLTAIEAGSVVVAASGETDVVAFPASVRGVISSGIGPSGRIPAPMIDVISTAPENRHRFVSGSSISAAHVSGVVALLLASAPDLTPAEVSAALQAAVSIDGDVAMLDACGALIAIGEQAGGCVQ
ncbi:hypothetical protein DS901_18245 [Loktanella sp. D2R18]|uniref:S8 family peptidase n=1 Tax=Rhodobacterales TaxID=204455 RepID=UPI000DEA3A7C|nr:MULTISPECIES: S8 family serine peptidase [Rhodobacterales]MDO6590534.1 S8 family serine peptidase [Yoonia sp. 1_MG-2023]RBW41251.1 hypothetical protein DS901_18245 [Loktanella sp. D2R18]